MGREGIRAKTNTWIRKTRCWLATAFIVALAPIGVSAQENNVLRVTVAEKQSGHPNAERGWFEGFVVEGQQGMSVGVVRGETYTFRMDGVPDLHPFYLSTSNVGLGADPYEDGVTNNFSTGNDELTFTPTDETPDVIYYQCQTHDYMGWRVYVMDEVRVGLQPVAQGLTAPVTMMSAGDGTGRLFVVDQIGVIYVMDVDGSLREEPFLDLRDRVVDLNPGFDERGALGLAFHPEFTVNDRLFVHYSAPLRDDAPSGWDNTTTLSEFQVSADDPNRADPESEVVLLEVDQPQFNHAGGSLLFGPDGYLYLALGDGGGSNDTGTGHVDDWYDGNEGGNAQNLEANLLGKILRIDVDAGNPYDVPAENPFVGRDGLDEIYAYGLRNPYRMSFDPEFGLLAADVGQNRWEEVNQIELGGNYGWNVKEGTNCFDTANPDQDATACPDEVGAGHPDTGAPLVDPLLEYLNAQQEGGLGHAVIGGHVYRGAELPELAGRYVFGDYTQEAGEPRGALFVATPQDEGRWPFQPIRVVDRPDDEFGHFLLGFGVDADGELYVLGSDMSGPTGTTGVVYRIVPDPDVVAAERTSEIPDGIVLHQNYPNPFNPFTTIRYGTAQTELVTLSVYDVLGRRVATLVDGVVPPGTHEVRWNARNDEGRILPSGTYLYRLTTGERSTTRVMTYVR